MQTSALAFEAFYGGKIQIVNASVDKPNSNLKVLKIRAAWQPTWRVLIAYQYYMNCKHTQS